MDRVAAQEARRAIDRVVGFPLSNLLGKKVAARLERRPRAVGRGEADRGPRARDRGVQDRGVLEDHRPARRRRARAWRGPPTRRSRRSSPRRRASAEARSSGTSRREADAVPDADEPVVDTEAERRPPSEDGAAPAAPVEKAGIPTPPEKAFLAELAKWDGAEPEARRTRPTADAIVAALTGRAVRRHQGRAEGPAGPAAAAVHHQHAAAAGEHPPAVQRQPDDADGPAALRGRRPRRRGPDRRSSPTCVPTARACRTTR